jgi:hypothetical protein
MTKKGSKQLKCYNYYHLSININSAGGIGFKLTS